MNIKIDELGNLWIFRGKRYKKQECPFTNLNGIFSTCGDWCPLFGNIEKYNAKDNSVSGYFLNLCHKCLEYIEQIDERGK